MKELANVEYFYRKCNEVLNTNYSVDDWGEQNTYKPINIEWLSVIILKVYNRIHNPKTKTSNNNFGCNLHLSSRFNYATSKLAVPIEVVNSVVNYLSKFNKPCDNECACYRNLNCHCDCTTACPTFCSGPATCTGTTVSPQQCECTCSNCDCNCTCPNCACECGNNSECQCDCNPYDCNCDIVKNCNLGNANPKTSNCTYNCGKCVCNCTCDPPPPPDCETECPCPSDCPCTPPPPPKHRHTYCEQCCFDLVSTCGGASESHYKGWLNGCTACYPNPCTSWNCANCPEGWWCCGED